MRNVKLLLAYDGTRYFGWQKTAMGPSIEEELKAVLEKITQQQVVLQAASRTDAGVHAEGQVVNFFLENDAIDLSLLHISLNQLLPPDIVVLKIKEAGLDFHPTLDARYKEYHYRLFLGPVQFPACRLYSWHCQGKLDLNAMDGACRVLEGEHDFSSFCNAKKKDKETNFIREITALKLQKSHKNSLVIMISGNRFLYRMARNIAGTLVYVGMGKIAAQEVSGILAGKDRKEAGMTAPAHGLTLAKVKY